MRYNSIIFDLDGTLLNTLGDLRNGVNHAMTEMGAAKRTTDEVRRFIGNGVAKLIERAMPEGSSDEDIKTALGKFRAYYNSHLNVETVPYPGVMELLRALKENRIGIYVNSNKYDAAVKELCESHFGDLIIEALGESADVPKKPSPVGAEKLVEMSGNPKEKVLYVGDSSVDMETARNACLDVAWVSWGFRTREEMGAEVPENAFDTAEELLKFILE